MSRQPPDRRRGTAGYALIEALVAFAIVAAALAIALPLFADGLRGAGAADQRLTALAFAENTLADAIGTAPPQYGATEGTTDDGLSWRLSIRRQGEASPGRQIAVEYAVEVGWPGTAPAEGLRLATIRLTRDAGP